MQKIETQKPLFSNRDIWMLIIPLFAEILLQMIVGFADSLMVSSVSEAAVSAVSLIDVIMVLVIDVFGALATGGAVVAGQALGRRDPDYANHAAHQLLIMAAACGVAVGAVLFVARGWVVGTLFGAIADDVMQNALTYISITAFTVPGIALYSACSSLFRTMGDSRTPLFVAFIMNIINVSGNAILIFGFGWGVEGVATSTLVARATACILALIILCKRHCSLQISPAKLKKFDFSAVRKMLKIALPNSLEYCTFQGGKIIMVSVIACFGTAQIAANSVSNTIASFQCIAGLACGQALVPVVARCVGAGSYDQVRHYTHRLLKISYYALFITNVPILIFLNQILGLYSTLSAEAVQYATWALTLHGIVCMILWPIGFALPSTLRASGDVRYCMIVSLSVMGLVRCVGGYLLATTGGLLMMGIWVATILDWCVRCTFLYRRYRGTRWQHEAL